MKTLIALAALLLAACHPVPPDYTESAETDAAWSRVLDCYAAAGHNVGQVRQPDVIVRTDCRDERSQMEFLGVEGAWVTGEAYPMQGYINVCPDASAALYSHEFSHVVHRAVLFNNGLHGAGCFGVTL